MSFLTHVDAATARSVVVAASTRTKDPAIKAYMLEDRKGTLETMAKELLLDQEVQARALNLGISTDAALQEAVADRISWLVLSAALKRLNRIERDGETDIFLD